MGLSTARALARRGCDLVLHYRSSEEEAREAASALGAFGALVRLERCDLEDPDAAEAMAGRLAGELPRLDILVHNASVYGPTPLNELSAGAMQKYFNVHAVSPALMTKALAPRLRSSVLPGGGAVVAMVDIHAIGRPRPGFLAYSMSKAALHEMVRTLARDLAPSVRVNGVAPGVVAWPDGPKDGSAEVLDQDEAMRAAYLKRVPLERSGTPEEAAEVVAWLAMDATYVTGQVIRVDGGRWLT